MIAPPSLTEALRQLDAYELWLERQLDATRSALAALRGAPAPELMGPGAIVHVSPGRKAEPPSPAVRKVLAGGPVSGVDFVERTGLSRYRMQKLADQGVIVLTGATSNRRVALAGSAAKEVP